MPHITGRQPPGNFCSKSSIAISYRAPPTPPKLPVVREKRSAREMDGRHLLGAAGAARANQNNAKIVRMAVPVLAMLLLLLTAAAVSMTADDRACLRAFFRSHMFLMFCVLVNTTSGCALAWMAVTAPTQAARRSYAESTVASFVLLAVNLHSALSNLPDVGDAA
ncbi:uncharacterized protein LOC125541356 isoform X1 [Triticum urartu]|uniref:uncharacterized protein LOC125541356 isoform X1 n=1 Tax=Triticum urartu TaxID=4572 RepID=UPI0020440D97|nr:uncharacterized protein LOC125541356 isoform X1 [Triticum urartu]